VGEVGKQSNTKRGACNKKRHSISRHKIMGGRTAERSEKDAGQENFLTER